MAQYFDVSGNNILQGTAGDDFFIFGSSGGGNDTVFGNGGNDIFGFITETSSLLWQRTITDFGAGDTIRVTGSQNITAIANGNGSNMQPYSVQVISEGGITSFFAEGNGDNIADIRVKFPGSYTASQFSGTPSGAGAGPLTDFTLISAPTPTTGQPTAGNDVLQGGSGADAYSSLDGNDTIYGNDGNDTLQGNQGADWISGGTGNDSLLGGKDNDYLHGNQGADIIAGNMGNDILVGGKDNDSIYGGKDEDNLQGELGSDALYGELGNDTIAGGKEADYLNGGEGNDRLSGDLGNDTLEGGAGNDVFVFNLSNGIDVLNDFHHGEDKLFIAPEIMSTQQAIASFSAGVLYLGGDNSVVLVGVHALTTSDFVLA